MSALSGIGTNLLSPVMTLTRLGEVVRSGFKGLRMASVLQLNQRLRHLLGATTIHRATKSETIPRPVLGNKERKK